MLDKLREYYNADITSIEEVMIAEMDEWSWQHVRPMKERVTSYLKRPGKRLRPLLMLIVNALFSGSARSVYPAGAAIEIYHTATLIYDDIQDNSEFRRGLPCAHITASTSMAMNQAGVIRSLMYHVIHRSQALSPLDKLEVRNRIDRAATQVSIGQCIDIGWHEGWYADYHEYPYTEMISGKSAALFGCAASVGAYLAGASTQQIENIERIAIDIGRLFQMVDDFLDIFGSPSRMQRPLYNDLHDGKLSYPVLLLLEELNADGRSDTAQEVLSALSSRGVEGLGAQRIVSLMKMSGIEERAVCEVGAAVARLEAQISCLNVDRPATEHLHDYLNVVGEQVVGEKN